MVRAYSVGVGFHRILSTEGFTGFHRAEVFYAEFAV